MADGRLTQAEKDARDLGYEQSGATDIGIIKRFLSPEALEALAEAKGKSKKDKLDYLDILLLTDPIYAQVYADAVNYTENVENAIERSLQGLSIQERKIQEKISDLKQSAYYADDNLRIYQDKNGILYHENGTQLSESEQSALAAYEHASWEEYQHYHEQLADIHRQRHEVEIYRDNVVTDTKNYLLNRDPPPEKENIIERMDHMDNHMPDIVRKHMETSHSFDIKQNFNDGVLESQNTLPLELAANIQTPKIF